MNLFSHSFHSKLPQTSISSCSDSFCRITCEDLQCNFCTASYLRKSQNKFTEYAFLIPPQSPFLSSPHNCFTSPKSISRTRICSIYTSNVNKQATSCDASSTLNTLNVASSIRNTFKYKLSRKSIDWSMTGLLSASVNGKNRAGFQEILQKLLLKNETPMIEGSCHYGVADSAENPKGAVSFNASFQTTKLRRRKFETQSEMGWQN